jgi:hypothetical protein
MIMRMAGKLLVLGLVYLCFQGVPVRAEYSLTVTKACDGAGIAGTADYLNVSISFEGCATPQGYHAVIRDATQTDLLELFYDAPSQQSVYLIDGIELSVSHTSEEMSQIRSTMMSKPIVSVARVLHTRLAKMGLDTQSDGMVALGALSVGIPEQPGPPSSLQVSCDECSSIPGNCVGCCGQGCNGCTGICTGTCHDHDVCERDGGPGINAECTPGLITAIASYVWSVFFTGGACNPPGPGCCSDGTCQDPAGCCDEGYHECCGNLCCSDTNPPGTCP